MDILEKRYVPSPTGVIDNQPPRQLPGMFRIHLRGDYTATEKLDLIAWLNEREAGYPTATVSAIRQ